MSPHSEEYDTTNEKEVQDHVQNLITFLSMTCPDLQTSITVIHIVLLKLLDLAIHEAGIKKTPSQSYIK